MIDQIRAIVREHHGWQLGTDNGVFRFRTEEACCAARNKLNVQLPMVRTFVTTDILVVTINDRFDEPSLGTSREPDTHCQMGSVVPMPVRDRQQPGRHSSTLLAGGC